MATKSTTNKLLGKLTDLFRKPDTEEAQDSEQSVQPEAVAADDSAFQQMLKQRRRNDAIRAYEFNLLRNVIRGGETVATHAALDSALASPQTRSSGMASIRRNSILDKIDGAEAHLEQWWGGSSAHTPVSRQVAPAAGTKADRAGEEDDLDLDFTGPLAISEDPPPAVAAPALSALQQGQQDAALMYAQGEFEAAATLLKSLLETPDLAPDAAEMLTFSLFDVYRCSGQQESFEALALDYAQRFGRSPAEWFTLSNPEAEAMQAQQELAFWKCPAVLDATALADCIAHHPADGQVCFINWLSLQYIDAPVAAAFARQLTAWCASTMELRWIGVDALMAALQMCRVSGDVAASQPWWLVQMDMLCLMQQPQAFEELALEYCVAFEVSPPSWKQVNCKLVRPDEVDAVLEFATTVPSGPFDAAASAHPEQTVFELSGNILGENPQALRQLRGAARTASQMVVSCARLGRIDHQAAPQLLGWAEECHARGCGLQFIYVPRLVLTYFHMLGMQKLASLSAGLRQ